MFDTSESGMAQYTDENTGITLHNVLSVDCHDDGTASVFRVFVFRRGNVKLGVVSHVSGEEVERLLLPTIESAKVTALVMRGEHDVDTVAALCRDAGVMYGNAEQLAGVMPAETTGAARAVRVQPVVMAGRKMARRVQDRVRQEQVKVAA